jgi:hypothetical protein
MYISLPSYLLRRASSLIKSFSVFLPLLLTSVLILSLGDRLVEPLSTQSVTGSWNGLAVKPMDRGKFCNRTSVVRIRVVSCCYTDGLVFHTDQY